MKPHIVLSVPGVRSASRPRALTENTPNTEHIPVIEFDFAFATDMPGDPNRKISMMVVTDSIHGTIFAVVARRKGGQDDYLDRLGLVRAELKCHQEPSTLDVANTLIKRCQSTNLMVTATPKGSKGSFGALRTDSFEHFVDLIMC